MERLDIRKITNLEGKKRKSTPRKRWINEVQEDLGVMSIKKWKNVTANKKEWRKIVQKVLQRK